MPLVNVYNYLSSVKPHITYRFNCDIWPYNSLDNNRESDGGYERRSFTIKKITQPTFKLDTEAKKYYGNTQFVIPVFKFGDTEMSITFEETDNMEVYRFLCDCYGQIAYMRSAVSNLINIEITQFDETMHNVVDRKHYIATLKSFENPSFNNNGYGSPVEISADFYVLYVYDEPLTNEKLDDKIALNHDGEGFIQDVMDADDYSTHLTGGKNAENLVDQEIKAAPKRDGAFKKNPKNEKRKQEIREEQADIRAAEKQIVSDQYNNIYDSLSDEDKLKFAQAAIDEYTKRNKGKKRETAHDEFNANKGLFIAKYLDNVTAEDGLSKDEIDTITANLKQLGADEKTIAELTAAFGVYEKKYGELEKEYTTLNQLGASSAPGKKRVNAIEKTKAGDVMSDGDGNSITVTGVKTVGNNKIVFVEDNKHGAVTFELPKSIVFHNQAATHMSMGTTVTNSASKGVTGTGDEKGSIVFDTDRLYSGNKSSAAKSKSNKNKNNENANKPVALELVGAVSVVESEDGKYYVRQDTGEEGVYYVEISNEEFNKRKGQQYTSETMEGDTQLEMNYKSGVTGTKRAKNSDKSYSDIKIKNMYSEAITDENLNAAYLFGIAIRTEAEKEAARKGVSVDSIITEEYVNSLSAYSHGMLDVTSGKMEGTPDDVRQLLSAVKQGLRGKSELNKEETKKSRKH